VVVATALFEKPHDFLRFSDASSPNSGPEPINWQRQTSRRKAATNGRWRCVSSENLLLSVCFDVVLSGFGCVVGRMGMVSLGDMRVMGSRFVIAILMVLSSFSVVVSGVLVVLGSLAVMMRCFLRHGVFLSLARGSEKQTSAC
jgi:hypothetical protein